jgi:uncharacterized protein (DUF1697 family)
MQLDASVPTHVALLRGINVGGHNQVAMADLRAVVASLGHTDVATYIQSGNVVFTARQKDSRRIAAQLERAIDERLGAQPRVVVLSRDELAKVVTGNPYAEEPNRKLVHVIFLSAQPSVETVAALEQAQAAAAAKGARDTVSAVGRAVFLHTPDGYGRSDLAARVARLKPLESLGATARNWATVTKLLSMCEA